MISLTDLSLAIGTPYGLIRTFVSAFEKSLIRDFRIFVIIFFVFFIFYSKRPRATQERLKSLIFVPYRSTSVRGVHRHQAIVILASHVSSENLCRLYGTTMRDAIFYRAPRLLCPHSNCARSLSRVFNLYLPLFFRGLAPSDCSYNTAKNM